MKEVESRQVDPSAITVIYGGGKLHGAIYKGFWLTITRDDCDIDEDGVCNNSKLTADYFELNPRPMCVRRSGSADISPYGIGFEDVAEWMDKEFEL